MKTTDISALSTPQQPVRATASEWVMAFNPQAAEWLAFPGSARISPFGTAAKQLWSIERSIKVGRKATCLGTELPENVNEPISPETARITAQQALTAVERYSRSNFLQRQIVNSAKWGVIFAAICAIVCAILVANKQMPPEIAEILVICALGAPFLWTAILLFRGWFRKKVFPQKDRMKQLREALWACRELQPWGDEVQTIFKNLESVGVDAHAQELAALRKRNEELAKQNEILASELRKIQAQVNAVHCANEEWLSVGDSSLKVPMSFLRNTLLQSGDPGFTGAIAVPIVLLTAWSLRMNPPSAGSKLQLTIYQRIEESAEIVRKHYRHLPAHRTELVSCKNWNAYVQSLKKPIYSILAPKDGDSPAYGTSHFQNKFPYLANVAPYQVPAD